MPSFTFVSLKVALWLGTADLEAEVYFIHDVNRSAGDRVYWVRREAAFAIGALARVVPIESVVKELVRLSMAYLCLAFIVV